MTMTVVYGCVKRFSKVSVTLETVETVMVETGMYVSQKSIAAELC